MRVGHRQASNRDPLALRARGFFFDLKIVTYSRVGRRTIAVGNAKYAWREMSDPSLCARGRAIARLQINKARQMAGLVYL